MANSSSKGLTIGIVALVVVVGLIFAISRHGGNEASPQGTNASKEATATPAADKKAEASKSEDAKSTETKTASADSKGSDTKADAGDELTSSTEDSQAADASKAAEAAKDDKAGDKKEAAASDKSDDKKDSGKDASAPDTGAGSGSLLAAPSSLDVDVDKAMADRTMGSPDAPVTMIEYASMTCPHCAHFSNDLFPEVKRQLIDTGKVRYIYRDYPLDTYAMKAALMARCADPDKYFDLVEVIFKNQEHWVKNPDPVKGLVQLGALAGMSPDYIKQCMANEELQSAILARVQDAQKNYKLDSTPTFIFNNGAEKFSGDKEVEDFVNVVKKLSGK